MFKKKLRLFPAYSNRSIFIGALGLVIYGTFMIASAEMSRTAGDSSVIIKVFLRQFLFILIGVAFMTAFARFNLLKLKKQAFITLRIIMAVFLLIPRLFGSLGGAYAWIRIGSISIQPSEFAKLFMIIYAGKLLGYDHGIDENINNFKAVMWTGIVYTAIILIWEKDFGSALVLAGITYIMLMISNLAGTKKYTVWLQRLLFIGIFIAILLLSPVGTSFLEKIGSDDYRIGRFLASANPFKDQYNTGYHLIMSLVSIANGGWFGVGYGKSIHKYMNFPNPSSDFIFAVIMEEMGVLFGLLPITLGYIMILYPLIRISLKTKSEHCRLILTGVFMYYILHIILNIGGVTGLIPLTGVPLLLLSSGGSSLVAALSSLGIAQAEIISDRKRENA